MSMNNLHFNDLNLKGKRVFLRADLNLPIADGRLLNDHKLVALQPTIDAILQRGGKIILATHLGRPSGVDPKLSTKALIPWFTAHGYQVQHEPNLARAEQLSHQDPRTILLLENLRFFKGEQTNDTAFAQQLAALGDYYINDAFALLHRNDTLITLVPAKFPPERKAFGPLVVQEKTALGRLTKNVAHPFVAIIGGGKVHDKLPLLNTLLDHVDTLLLCPAIVFTFTYNANGQIGKSLVDRQATDAIQQFLVHAQKKGVKIVVPLDYQIALDTFDGPLSVVDAAQFPANGIGISIGPKTAELFGKEIEKAGTIFFNGLPGVVARPETLTGAAALFKAMEHSNGFSVIAGGDSVAAAQQLGLEKGIDYCSTGGGAALAYITGEPMPGLLI
jgi:phosphoglycerate kinase